MIWLIKREPYLLPLLLSCEWHLLDRQRPEDGNLDCVVCCLVSVSFGAEIRMRNYVGERKLTIQPSCAVLKILNSPKLYH